MASTPSRPPFQGEHVTGRSDPSDTREYCSYDQGAQRAAQSSYLTECSTINLAFTREAFNAIGGFDETFAYGSDVDYSWRLTDASYRIRSVPDAIVRHDWG